MFLEMSYSICGQCFHHCLVTLLLLCVSTTAKTNLGCEKCLFGLQYMVHRGNPRQEFKARTEAEAAESEGKRGMLCLLACSPACTAPFLRQPRLTCLGLELPVSISNEEDAAQTCLLAIWWRKFLSWGSLFPNDASLCQVDKNLTNTASQVFL